MKTDLFDFNLPSDLIAQNPIVKRDSSNLLVVDKITGTLEDNKFSNIINYLNKNDVLILNETKVIPARLIGKKNKTGAVIEVLLLKEIRKDVWEVVVKPAKRIKIGDEVLFSNLKMKCIDTFDEGIKHFEMFYEGIFLEIIEKIGVMPLPPYIKETLKDNDRYQTVYANNLGSAAAPTAGLHFTKELLSEISKKGIEIIKITLSVGLGTFRPVKEELIENHEMHYESYYISEEAANKLNEALKNNKRFVAVGTTSVRTLEDNYKGVFKAGNFNTNIFIYPGYKFKVVGGLLTNFHLPKSTLFMLVSAFSTTKIMKEAYQHAICEKYRFFSFGDAMFIK